MSAERLELSVVSDRHNLLKKAGIFNASREKMAFVLRDN